MSVLIDVTTLEAQNITQSDTTVFDPPLKLLQVFPDASGGVIEIRTFQGNTVTYTIPDASKDNGIYTPFIIPGLIRQIRETNTTVANAAMIGYR